LEKGPIAGRKQTRKMRLDLLLVERALVPSRERARALILAGRVLVREQRIDKPGTTVPEDAAIRLLGEERAYVSRGGLKLERALEHWRIAVTGRSCLIARTTSASSRPSAQSPPIMTPGRASPMPSGETRPASC